MLNELLEPIKAFLQCETPQSWIDEAIKPENLSNFTLVRIQKGNYEQYIDIKL